MVIIRYRSVQCAAISNRCWPRCSRSAMA
jgi:hypothetical protein